MECPNCEGRVLSPQGPNGEKVCSRCGLVLTRIRVAREQSFSPWNPEWYSNWHESDSDTMREWLTTLRTVSCQLNLPSFPYREEAARRIRKDNKILFRSQKFGKNKKATIAAILYQVLRQYGKNRSLQEICKQLSLDSTIVMKQSWALNKTVMVNQRQFIAIPRKTSVDYLFEYGGKITRYTQLLVEAEETLMKIRRKGGNPIALASGALYHVCKNEKLSVSKEQIAEVFGISHRTVYANEAQIRAALQRIGFQKTNCAAPQKIPLLTVDQRRK